jgi:hypothetical protein
MAGQKQNGTTVNMTVSQNATTGVTTVAFVDPFSMEISLGTSSGVNVRGAPQNNRFMLGSSTGDVLMGGVGNDVFIVANGATDLGGDVLKGGAGVNIVQLKGEGTEVDLTGVSAGTSASTEIEAVVGFKGLAGEIVDLNVANLSSSTLTNGGTGPGKAFVALIGADGIVNLTAPTTLHFVGMMDSSGAGFAADGTPLDAPTTAALAAEVTKIDNVQGTLGAMYTGGSPSTDRYAADNLSAYVFSSGAKLYTIWSDGTINLINASTSMSTTLFQPAPATATNPTLGTIPLFDPKTAGAAIVTTTNAGLTSVQLTKDAPGATGAIVVTGGVSGLAVHGDHGSNGGDWYSIVNSGGGNLIYGTPANDVFDLGNSTALLDTLLGRGGFDIVSAKTDGTDVDLTGLSNGIPKSTGIDGVVGSVAGTQTVEINLTSLDIVRDSSGNRTSVFEAMLGSSTDTVTVSGLGNWQEVATISPGSGSPLPTGATALTAPTLLDTQFNSQPNSGRAENTLTGYLFEQLGKGSVVLRYATVWTDATIVSPFVQAMSSLTSSSTSGSTGGITPPTNDPTTPLTTPGAA